ncbi:ATP-binding cassette domain-containing protein [Streptomyces sp. ODS28]|uniref:ATP-binding cassette domain-containing protein n=1 Tax=Streptomyces sp. ODS28 TaxID=3136688 RepID=UPI0031EBD712
MTLELNSVSYTYNRRSRPVLEHLSYQMGEGLTILLGPNGAGKSTLLKLAAGVNQPDSGTVTLDGHASGTRAYRAGVAWMPQHITAMAALTAREQVAYSGWLKGMSRQDAWREASRALARVDLSQQAGTKTRKLSGGQLRRVGVASALVHGARALLLDEPTAGMDSRQRRIFRDLLNTLTGQVQVLLSTHDVVDLAEDADQVTVLDQGRIAYTGNTRGFLEHAPQGTAEGRMAEAAYAELATG